MEKLKFWLINVLNIVIWDSAYYNIYACVIWINNTT